MTAKLQWELDKSRHDSNCPKLSSGGQRSILEVLTLKESPRPLWGAGSFCHLFLPMVEVIFLFKDSFKVFYWVCGEAKYLLSHSECENCT